MSRRSHSSPANALPANSGAHSDIVSHSVVTFICHDGPGIVHAVSGAVVAASGNISESQQFSSADTGRFFLRMQVESPGSVDALTQHLRPVAEAFDADLRVDVVGRPVRMLILASTAAHCLNDLLFRQHSGQLPIEVPVVVSNHPDLADLAGFYRVGFEYVKVTADSKPAFEDRLRQLIAEYDIELVVLARFMQILSDRLCTELAGRAINIHHSFLPGFKGANPYRQAHERGVKLIGATAHFVTADLDEGPIIEQNVVRVDHSHNPQQLKVLGSDTESQTLAKAVQLFAEHRVLLDKERTIVFR